MVEQEEQGRIGSSFEDFLAEEGLLDECTTAAIKRVLARQVQPHVRTGVDRLAGLAKAGSC